MNFRIPLRSAAIPLLGRAHEEQRTIPLTDLDVVVIENDVVVWSRSLNKRVVPRLDTAHNFTSPLNLALYSFLGLLQLEGTSPNLAWSWYHLEGSPFLPRVTFGRVVLRRAEWNVRADQLAFLRDSSVDPLAEIARWRAAAGVPRFVRLTSGDNALPIDLEHPISVIPLLRELKGSGRAHLVENYPSDESLIAVGEDGKYFHEVIVPFQRKPVRGSTQLPIRRGVEERGTFGPSSQWLYLKIYAGAGLHDQILRESIRPLVEWAQAENVIDNWFFLRFSDPMPHLRIRLHGAAQTLRTRLAERLHEIIEEPLRSGVFSRVQYDTYRRELGRYGGADAIANAEELFGIDSTTALSVLLSYADEIAEVRMPAAVRSTLAFLADCDLSTAQQCTLLEASITVVTPTHRQRRSSTFRTLRKNLELVVRQVDEPLDEFARIREIYRERSRATTSLLPRWIGKLHHSSTPSEWALRSMLHMSMNRLGLSRSDEDDAYDYALRLLKSSAARQR